MAVRHRTLPCHGVQFHPESILTPEGARVLKTSSSFAGKPVMRKDLLAKAAAGQHLTRGEALTSGAISRRAGASPSSVPAFWPPLRPAGETPEELAGRLKPLARRQPHALLSGSG